MVNEQVLDQRLAVLEAARPWSPRVIAKLEGHIRTADDEALFRINPLTFAKDKVLAEDEVIDLLLHATACRLFRMDWLLLCPNARASSRVSAVCRASTIATTASCVRATSRQCSTTSSRLHSRSAPISGRLHSTIPSSSQPTTGFSRSGEHVTDDCLTVRPSSMCSVQ